MHQLRNAMRFSDTFHPAVSFLTIISSYWVYFLDKIHVLYWIGQASGHVGLQTADITWGWYLTPNFAFFGAGLIIPAATLLSFLGGSIIAFGIGGPLMIDSGYVLQLRASCPLRKEADHT